MAAADQGETKDGAGPPRRLVRAEQVLAHRTRRVAVLLEGSQDPHNVHAVLRTAEALGVQDVHLVALRREAGAISPGVTQRSHQWLTVHRHASIDEAVAVLRGEGRRVWAARPGLGATPLTQVARETGRVAIALGNETKGLSERALELADDTFRIDLAGFGGSLNLSVAAAIALWELRRRELEGAFTSDLTIEEKQALRDDWYRRLLGRRVGGAARAEEWLARCDEVERAAREAGRPIPLDRTRRAPD